MNLNEGADPYSSQWNTLSGCTCRLAMAVETGARLRLNGARRARHNGVHAGGKRSRVVAPVNEWVTNKRMRSRPRPCWPDLYGRDTGACPCRRSGRARGGCGIPVVGVGVSSTASGHGAAVPLPGNTHHSHSRYSGESHAISAHLSVIGHPPVVSLESIRMTQDTDQPPLRYELRAERLLARLTAPAQHEQPSPPLPPVSLPESAPIPPGCVVLLLRLCRPDAQSWGRQSGPLTGRRQYPAPLRPRE